MTPVAGGSADVREDPAKGGGERVRIALLAEPAVVAWEDHRLGPKSLRHGQRGAVGRESNTSITRTNDRTDVANAGAIDEALLQLMATRRCGPPC